MRNMIALLGAGLLTGAGLQAQTAKPDNPRPLEHPRGIPNETPPVKKEPTSPEPAKPAPSAPNTRKGPVAFRISGAEAWEVASRAGWRFIPKGARGTLDGRGTTAQMHPGVTTSIVDGPRMTQMRTPAGWGTPSQNAFFMFADAAGRAKPLAAGWTVRSLELTGDPFQWLVKPRTGTNSPFFAIQISGQRSAQNTTVELKQLVLEGPADAKDWREAFAGQR